MANFGIWTFIVLGLVTLGGAIAVMLVRNLVRCALCLVVTFAGLAGIYLQLGAEFIGLVQVLVYIGAVAVLILFALLLTRGTEQGNPNVFAPGWIAGMIAAAGVFGVLAGAVLGTGLLRQGSGAAVSNVRNMGELLMGKYVLPLQVAGLLLTAALIGGVIVALHREEHR